jgi:predicted cupin superfamily sugar epimerase
LSDASKNDDLEDVKLIISKDSSLLNEELDEAGCTALCKASEFNHSTIISFLLEQKDIDVNKTTKVSVRFWYFDD